MKGTLISAWVIFRLLVRRFRSLLVRTGHAPGMSADQSLYDPPLVKLPMSDLPDSVPWYSLSLCAGQAEWTETGMLVRAGEEFTLFADGYVILSRLLDLKIGPAVGLWYRIGAGKVSKFPSGCATVRASESGEVQLAIKPPGEWAQQDGTFDPHYPREAGRGGFAISMVHWKNCAAKQGMEEWLTRAGHSPIVRTALGELHNAPQAPRGWNYLWRLGEGHIYQMLEDQPHSIHCHTHEDVGILQYPIDTPLTDDLVLNWQWKVERLPSQIREDAQPTHDYLSIAVEFDNGFDLTYIWSSELPVGKIFQCPLPWWCDRETHWVVRSGQLQLGQWLTERRCLLDDYRSAIGGSEPARVAAVWLIAVSVFQRNSGICDYRGIAFSRADGSAIFAGPAATVQKL